MKAQIDDKGCMYDDIMLQYLVSGKYPGNKMHVLNKKREWLAKEQNNIGLWMGSSFALARTS